MLNKLATLLILYLSLYSVLAGKNADGKNADGKNADDCNNAIYIAGGAIIGGIAATFALPALLAAAGFTSAGVVAGSLAAAMQPAAVASGSLFATAQSLGALGGVSAAAKAGLTATGAGFGYMYASSKCDKDSDECD